MNKEVLVAVSIFASLVVFLELGFRLGRRRDAGGEGPSGAQVGAVQGAVLGLLGLLLGFSFAGAATRFLDRQDLIVTEANAIGTAYLRTDLLENPHRGALRTSLRDYTRHRLEVSSRVGEGLTAADVAEIERLQQTMWKAASEGAMAKPATMPVVVPSVNDVIDLHSLRLAAGRKHLPLLVLGLLMGCSLMAVAVIGYGCGLGGRRHGLFTFSLVVLIGTALWTTVDLDHPRAGLLRLSDEPLRALKFDEP